MKVIAVDPGEVTGYVVCPDIAQVDEWTVHELPWELAQDALWREVEESPEPVQLVAERYIITAATLKKTRQYAALYVIGGLWLMTRRLPCSLHLQLSSDALGFATNDKLKRLGWYERTQHFHDDGRSAARHFTLWATEMGHLDARRLLP